MLFPKKQWRKSALIDDYEKLYQYSIIDSEKFWESITNELLRFKPWNKVLKWQYPYTRWFVNGKTNIVYNALDRWLKTPISEKPALIWVSQNGKEKKFTYRQSNKAISSFAFGLKNLGVRKGDRVTICLPRIPHRFIIMLTYLKIGAIHPVISGFSSWVLIIRIKETQDKVINTDDWYSYKDKIPNPSKNVHEAIKNLAFVNRVIIIRYLYDKNLKTDENNLSSFASSSPRFHFWEELVKKQDNLCSTAIMSSTDPSFILYSSGITGKPKGVIHSHGEYMVGVYATTKYIFNLHLPQLKEIFWSTVDAGWITSHSYILYGPLLNEATSFVCEGTPNYHDIEIWWRLIDKYQITHFYTAPTAIRMLMRYGEEPLKKYSLSSLKILGSVGEPINPEARPWFYFKPFFGVNADVVDENGQSLRPAKASLNTGVVSKRALEQSENGQNQGKQGYLVIKTPWPSMLLDLWQNPQKYKETYFKKAPLSVLNDLGGAQSRSFGTSTPTGVKNTASSSYPNFLYFTGDMAKIDEDGYFWIVGRNDDVIKVSGYRLGSSEFESAFVGHRAVAETAVFGLPDEVKEEKIKVYVIFKINHQPTEKLKTKLKKHVRNLIDSITTPDGVGFDDKLPKTRTGRLMCLVLKAQTLSQPVGDIYTLED